MGVQDGFPVSASYTNPKFISKNTPDVMPYPLGFTGSGTDIADIQLAVNKLYTATGASESTTGTVYNATAGTVSNGDTYEECITILADKFDAATGHKHTGAAGDAPILDVVLTAAVSGTGGTPVFGNITFEAGSGITINQVGNNFTFNSAAGTTVAASGYPQLSGDVVLVAGTGGISITQAGQNIIFEAGGGGGGSSLTIDQFSGDGSTTGFTLSADPGTEANTWIFISGVYQEKTTYSASGTALNFSEAPPLGTNNIEVVTGGVAASVPSDGSVTYAKLGPNLFIPPTVQTFIADGTYTLPTSPRPPLYIQIRAIGAGGGGGGSGTSAFGNGSAGTDTTITGSGHTITCGGGGGATSGGGGVNGGIGGTASVSGAGISGSVCKGNDGGNDIYQGTGTINTPGGYGAGGLFGGGANRGTTTVEPNSGAGGGGGQTSSFAAAYSGGGGASGGWVDIFVTNPENTYAIVIGVGGAKGTAGVNGADGVDGSDGKVEIREFYQ